MSTKADKGRDLPAVEPQQTPVAVQQPQVTDQQPTSTATYEGEFAVSKGAGYPSATQISGQGTVNTTQNSGQGEAGATNNTGQNQTVTTPQVEYKYPWETGMTMDQAYAQGKHSWHDIYMDRYRWGVANNNPVNVFEASMMLPQNHDIQKTKTQNEDDIKKTERKEKFDKIGMFLTHLGNFVGAVGFGGLDVKPEDPVKFTERQQRLKDKTEALRMAYNKEWFANAYKQMNAERQAELAKANAEYKAAQAKATQQRADDNTRVSDSRIERNQALNEQGQQRTEDNTRMTDSRIERYNVQNKVNQQNANTSSTNAQTRRMAEERQRSPQTVETTDARGRTSTRTTYRGKKSQQSTERRRLGLGIGKK